MAARIYPVFGHWAWGGGIYTEQVLAARPDLQGWLQGLGFHDYAGSTVVHSVGGWCGLVFTLFLGSRAGRFKSDGSVNLNDFPATSRGYAILGVFMLWFGWWGFNGGSGLKYDDTIAGIIFNTNLAGSAAGLSAYVLAVITERTDGAFFKKGFIPEKVIGGILGGLVAITASCDRATPVEAFFIIGLSAGIVHNLVFDLLLHFKIDDPVGAVPVHAGCGVLGTLLVSITYPDAGKQLGIQALGAVVAFVWTFGMAALLALILRALHQLPQRRNIPPSTSPLEPVQSPDPVWTV
jgi:Amt family ammonium transporter